ncbi:2-C-methyl-D-erythritol 4-phosphate cytidylyltransferase [Polaromonas sp. A23]|uniref:2-C-methyl-D-erythritol 4-phosphate cytidylyltransferase n=1 Tax=Polaromonas sp. A23 TaxID=1944133 RepID=UPI000985D9B1|nr:2-C-methyl-D-erythritol 4-phosphate cytidylyltransferase [Polaromonas sp. A23]OOG39435.1 2-C-methyl-D-erythritol 4-phosphate cytidylyltransferase [Polaromonas sp. A23]
MTTPPPKSLIPSLFALIPCAGQGTRAVAGSAPEKGRTLPKQYQPIAGLPMVRHTLQAFAGVDRIDSCVVVVAPEDSFFGDQPADGFEVVPCGGPTRAASVLNGLNHLAASGAAPDDWVLVHDAARCLVTPELIDRLIDACHCDPVGGLLAQPVPDTLKQSQDERVLATVDRSDKWLAQTPQMFRLAALTQALEMARTLGEPVTDEASAMEAAGLAPQLVRGSAHNFKVTYPEDFELAEALIKARSPKRTRKAAAPKAAQKVLSDDTSRESA